MGRVVDSVDFFVLIVADLGLRHCHCLEDLEERLLGRRAVLVLVAIVVDDVVLDVDDAVVGVVVVVGVVFGGDAEEGLERAEVRDERGRAEETEDGLFCCCCCC